MRHLAIIRTRRGDAAARARSSAATVVDIGHLPDRIAHIPSYLAAPTRSSGAHTRRLTPTPIRQTTPPDH
jgi:hypothetical protein